MALCMSPVDKQKELLSNNRGQSLLSCMDPVDSPFQSGSQTPVSINGSDGQFQGAWRMRNKAFILGGACIEANLSSTEPTLSGSSQYTFLGSTLCRTSPPGGAVRVADGFHPPLSLAAAQGPFAVLTWPPKEFSAPSLTRHVSEGVRRPSGREDEGRSARSGPLDDSDMNIKTEAEAGRSSGKKFSLISRREKKPPANLPTKSPSAGNLLRKAFSKPMSGLLSPRPGSIPEKGSSVSGSVPVSGIQKLDLEEGRVVSWHMSLAGQRLGPSETRSTRHPGLAFGCHWVETLAGQDRVHVVAADDRDFLFAAVYDGFNDVAATEFLTVHLCNFLVARLASMHAFSPRSNGAEDSEREEIMGAMSESMQAAEESYLRYAIAHGGMSDSSTSSNNSGISAGAASTSTDTSDASAALEVVGSDEISNWGISGCPPDFEKTELPVAGAAVVVTVVIGGDLYVMNVGDASALLVGESGPSNGDLAVEVLTEEHSTSNEKEVARLKGEREDDPDAIKNGRVKGKLKLTRAFGAPYLKDRSINDSLIGYMRVKYVGTKPYVSSRPYLRHVSVSDSHKYLVLSSDGLFRHQSVADVASLVKDASSAKGKSPLNAEQTVGGIARLLVDKALSAAAKKNGKSVQAMLSVPAGEHRREMHDDLSVVVVKLG